MRALIICQDSIFNKGTGKISCCGYPPAQLSHLLSVPTSPTLNLRSRHSRRRRTRDLTTQARGTSLRILHRRCTAQILRDIVIRLSGRTTRALTYRVFRNENAVRRRALDVERIFDLVKDIAGVALDGRINASRLVERGHDLGVAVCRRPPTRRHTATPKWGGAGIVLRLAEEIDDFFLRGVVGVAFGVQGAVACAVCPPDGASEGENKGNGCVWRLTTHVPRAPRPDHCHSSRIPS
jgi:hypothetical protein